MITTESPLHTLIDANIYARYSGILSLSDISLFLVGTNGDVLHELIPSPDFCTQICQKGQKKLCTSYKSRIDAAEDGLFTCQYGLENILLPIKLHEETVGYVAGMKVYTKENEHHKFMINTLSLEKETGLELEFIAKSIASLKIVEENKIKIHEQLCNHIANNISIDLSKGVSHLDSDVKRLSIEKEMLEKKIIDLEAKNMSLVINPHFLFNTLNCIARIAYFEQSEKTEELIYCLSDLLRYNLKQDNQLHTIESEIDNIEKYLYIQKVRFNNRLEYSLDIPENLKSYRIPNMVLQPIVENAVIHGIEPKRDGGKISIEAKETENAITIFISDNGNGFQKNVLKKLEQTDENHSGIGFWSTNQRLKQYYGEFFGLEIVKSDFSGSTIAVKIPTQPTVRC